eukprot:9964925-Alexandrium_andersonii.AAC.1
MDAPKGTRPAPPAGGWLRPVLWAGLPAIVHGRGEHRPAGRPRPGRLGAPGRHHASCVGQLSCEGFERSGPKITKTILKT